MKRNIPTGWLFPLKPPSGCNLITEGSRTSPLVLQMAPLCHLSADNSIFGFCADFKACNHTHLNTPEVD